MLWSAWRCTTRIPMPASSAASADATSGYRSLKSARLLRVASFIFSCCSLAAAAMPGDLAGSCAIQGDLAGSSTRPSAARCSGLKGCGL